MSIHICRGIGKRCWNLEDSYGEICVGCGCCSPDVKTRQESRLRVSKRHLQDELDFDNWADDFPRLKAIQERNRKSNIRYYKRRIRYYEKAIAERSGK